jgi:hypothetical protein
MFLNKQLVLLFSILSFFSIARAQTTPTTPVPQKTFDQQGLAFEYSGNWELGGQTTGEVQQLVLTEKSLDAQIMVIVPRSAVTNAKEEEAARQSVVDPTINRLLNQYHQAGIQIEQVKTSGEVGDRTAQGVQLRFVVDRQQGVTDIYWLVMNQRMVQLIFLRPEKTSTQSAPCWDLIRRTLKIRKS